MARSSSEGTGGPGEGDGRKMAAARELVECLAELGEPVRFGQITIHVAEGRVWLEIRKTYK